MSGRTRSFLFRLVLEEEDPTALGLLRVLLVTVFTTALLAHIGAVGEYFSDDSMINGEYARKAFHSRWSLFFYVQAPFAVRTIFAIGVVAHVCWILGYFTRFASLLAWALWVSLIGRNPNLYAFPDQLLMALVTWMMVVPAGRGLSLDAKMRGKHGTVPVWCRRIFQLQFAVLYAKSVSMKTGTTWSEGTAVFYTVSNAYNRHFDLGPLLALLNPWIFRPATHLVAVWQSLFALFVGGRWLREMYWPERKRLDMRVVFLGYGLAFHMVIQILVYVVWFSALCILGYAAFLTPSEARRAVDRLRRVGRSRSVRSADAAKDRI